MNKNNHPDHYASDVRCAAAVLRSELSCYEFAAAIEKLHLDYARLYQFMTEKSPLHEMFRLQEELNLRCGCNIPAVRLDPKSQNHWILQFCRAIDHERSELEDSADWKWWRPEKGLDAQNARVEVIDLFHFVISAAQVLGMSADDVFEAYLKKNKVNHERQDSGYVVKDENDCKHI